MSDALLTRQRESWNDGECLTVEELLQSDPPSAADSQLVLDLIYSEVLIREEQGENVIPETYTDRFPHLADDIRRQFQLHECLKDSAEAADLETIAEPQVRSTAAPRDLKPQIPGFEVEDAIGQGGSGIVYRARDTALNRTVAIKVLRSLPETDAESRRRLLHEAESVAALVHPNIVRVHQVGETDSFPFLVMDYVEGGTLAAKLEKESLPAEDAARLVAKIAEAVHYAHQSGIVHRDLKPGNIILDAAGNPHITDFGLARRLDGDATLHSTGDVIGTPAYMSPEQARGERAGTSSDIYALGVILFETLLRRTPFEATTPFDMLHQVLTRNAPSAKQIDRTVPGPLDTICTVCLAPTPDRRFTTAGDLADELQRYLDKKPILSRRPSVFSRLAYWCRRNPLPASLSVLVFLSLVTVAVTAVVSQKRIEKALGDTEDALVLVESQRDVAFDAMNDLVYRVYDDLTKREASVEARREVLESAISGLQKVIDAGGAENSEVMLTMAMARSRYGYILAQQGETQKAEQQYLDAIAICEEEPGDEAKKAMARHCTNLALHYTRVANSEGVRRYAEKSNNIINKLIATFPDDPNLKLRQALNTSHLASAAAVEGNLVENLRLLRDARKQLQTLVLQEPDDASPDTELVNVDLLLANYCVNSGELQEAQACLEEALPIIRRDSPESSDDVHPRIRFYTALYQLGRIEFMAGRTKPALETINEAVQGYEKLVNAEPNRPGFRLKLGSMLDSQARCLYALGDIDQAITSTVQQIEQFQKGMELGGPEYEPQIYAIVMAKLLLADLRMHSREPAKALTETREAAALLKPIAAKYNDNATLESVERLAEVIAAMNNEDSLLEEAQRHLVHRLHELWHEAHNSEFESFKKELSELEAKLQAESDPIVRLVAAVRFLQILGLQHQFGTTDSAAGSPNNDELEQQIVTIIRGIQTQPGGNAFIQAALPELSSFRRTSTFRKEFSW